MSAEDIALGYKQLFEVEGGWRTLKTTLDLRPVYHTASTSASAPPSRRESPTVRRATNSCQTTGHLAVSAPARLRAVGTVHLDWQARLIIYVETWNPTAESATAEDVVTTRSTDPAMPGLSTKPAETTMINNQLGPHQA